MEWDPVSEHQGGVLCEQGFMKERYEEKIGELIRTFTPKGIKVVKNILKDIKYQKIFINILYNEIRDFPKTTQVGIVEEIKRMLTRT